MSKTFNDALWAAYCAGRSGVYVSDSRADFETWRRKWAGEPEAEPVRCFGSTGLWECTRNRGHEGDHEYDEDLLNRPDLRIGAMSLRQIADREPGWDDVCRDCPTHRYLHLNQNHPFISEEE